MTDLAARDRADGPGLGGWASASAIVSAVAVVWHAGAPANTDVTWLLTVGERIAAGAVPYKDIIETNPPGSILLYMPAVWAGIATGVRPELWTVLITSLACVASLAFCGVLLGPLLRPGERGPLLCAGVAVVMLLPAGSFAQREHVILLGLLPLLCCIALHATGRSPPVGAAVLAGLGASLALAIKPYYGLGLVAALPCVLWTGAGRRALSSSVALSTAAALALLLGCLELLAFPAFTTSILPLLSKIYIPARVSVVSLMTEPAGFLPGVTLCLYGALRLWRRSPPSAAADVAAAAAVGFLTAYLVQGKGWPYHGYPAAASAFLALAIQGWRTLERSALSSVVAISTALVFATSAARFDQRIDMEDEAPGLAAALTRLAPHPRILSLSSDIAVGHPLTRQVDGHWVGRLMSSWISLNVRHIATDASALESYRPELRLEDQILAGDIEAQTPDAILASVPGWTDWIAGEPQVAGALTRYRLAGTYGFVMLFVRRDP